MEDVVGQWRDRSVLVTGSHGLVGRRLVAVLLAAGARVACLDKQAHPAELLPEWDEFASQVTVLNGRVEDAAAVAHAAERSTAEVLFHLAAQTIVSDAVADPIEAMTSNVQGTWTVLDLARRDPGRWKSVVVASSDKAYGDGELPYVEEQALRGRHPYDVSKSCTDLIAAAFAHTYSVPVLIARCGNIFGGGDLNWSRIVPGTIRSLLAGEQPVIRSDGRFVRDYIHVDDVVSGYLRLAEAGWNRQYLGQAFNFSLEQPITVLEMYERIGLAVGVEVTPVVLNQVSDEIRTQYLSVAKARDLLGWHSIVGLDEGLTTTVEWYRDYFQGRRR